MEDILKILPGRESQSWVTCPHVQCRLSIRHLGTVVWVIALSAYHGVAATLRACKAASVVSNCFLVPVAVICGDEHYG